MTEPRNYSWRVVDIVITGVLAVACALVFWLWAAAWNGLSTLFIAFPPAVGLLSGGWLIAGPLAGLIVRKPGAALICEVLAAVIEMALGSHYGIEAVVSGIFQGLGAELAFLVFGYRRFGFGTALLSGALAGVVLGVSENVLYNNQWAFSWQVAYVIAAAISGVVIAGLLMWAVVRGLARTGVLSAFAAGRTGREV